MATDARAEGRWTAWVTVIVVHMLLAWMLLHVGTVTLPVAEGSSSLQIVWVKPAPNPAAPIPAPAAGGHPGAHPVVKDDHRSATRRRQTPPTTAAQQPVDAVEQTAIVDTGSTSRPLSATFVEQARELARDRHPASIAAPDPFANRVVALPAADRGRFRMQDSITPAAVVQAVGRLFGGGPSDPCPRIDANLANLGTGGDTELLREEIRRKRSYCH